MHGALPIRDLNRCHNLWICLRTSTRMLQTIRSLSLLTSKLRRWSARMSLLRSSSSQPHLSSIPFCPYSCGFLLHPLVAQSVVQSRCYPRPRTSLLGSSVGNDADIFKPRLVSASSGAVCMGSADPGWRVSLLLDAASVPVLVDSRAPSSRGASSPLPDGRPDPTISTSGSLRSSPLASTTVELLRSLSGCSRCCTSASSSRCMSSSMRALHSSECGFVTLSAPAARVAQAAHSGVGPYRATSCFRMYLRLCCGVQTIDSGKGITTAGIGGGLTHPRNSSTSSDELIVRLLVFGFPLNSRASQQSTL